MLRAHAITLCAVLLLGCGCDTPDPDEVGADALCDRAVATSERVEVSLPANAVVPDPVIRTSSAAACVDSSCCNYTTHLAVLTCPGADDITFEAADGTEVECEAQTEGSGGSVGVEASADCLARSTTDCPLGGTTIAGSLDARGVFVLE